jgi:hypothetical protein
MSKVKNEKKILKDLYKFNQETNSYIVEVKLKTYSDIFNDLDPSPIKKRDLDQDFISYMDDSFEYLPLNCKVELHFYIPEKHEDIEKEKRIRTGIKTYYDFMMLFVLKQIKKLRKEVGIFIIISVFSLFTSFFLSSTVETNYFYKIIIEGFNIGGWVFLWEAINILIFKIRKLKDEIIRYERISTTPINFFSK